MDNDWIDRRVSRLGWVIGGKHIGAEVTVEPDDRLIGIWHIYIAGGPSAAAFDIWADDDAQLKEWLLDGEFQIQLEYDQ